MLKKPVIDNKQITIIIIIFKAIKCKLKRYLQEQQAIQSDIDLKLIQIEFLEMNI